MKYSDVEKVSEILNNVLSEWQFTKDKKVDHFYKAFTRAFTCLNLREEFKDNTKLWILISIMRDTQGFFQTDRSFNDLSLNNNIKPYPWNTISNCVIEALLQGCSLMGDEFKIEKGKTVVIK